MENRPTGHRKNVSGRGKSVYRRGEGLGTGPVTGSRPDNFGSNTQSIHETGRKTYGRNVKRGGGALSLLAIVVLLLFGGGNLLGGDSDSYTYSTQTPTPTAYVSTSTPRDRPAISILASLRTASRISPAETPIHRPETPIRSRWITPYRRAPATSTP